MERIPPKQLADQLVKVIRKQQPDPNYLKKVFQYVGESLDLKGGTSGNVRAKKLPNLMTEDELKRFYKAVWNASNRSHMVMLKLILYTGIRNE